ncbi:MAG: hypothetical protein KQJ78_17500 [Deltaproteobacteria bacterium]|nr:hypothetical protein [Deltaproteobacteria bacterium]
MKWPRLRRWENFLTLGLVMKAAAVILALALVGPPLAQGPDPVEAQEQPASNPSAPSGDQAAGGEAAATPADGEGKPQAQPEAGPTTGQEEKYDPRLVKMMEERREQLDREEERLKRERADLEKMKQDVVQRVAELKKVQAVLEKLVQDEQSQRANKVAQLVKVLSNMRAEAAGDVISKLDDQLAVDIFMKMQSRISGKVMGCLDPVKAARISVLLTKQKEAQDAAQIAASALPAGQPPAAPPPAAPAAPPAPAQPPSQP